MRSKKEEKKKYASFLANIVLTVDLRIPQQTFHSFFEDEKHQEDQAARNVDGHSLISLNFRGDV